MNFKVLLLLLSLLLCVAEIRVVNSHGIGSVGRATVLTVGADGRIDLGSSLFFLNGIDTLKMLNHVTSLLKVMRNLTTSSIRVSSDSTASASPQSTPTTLAPPSSISSEAAMNVSVLQISSGAYHVCALLDTTHGVRCWGANFYGQLGIGNKTNLTSPPNYDVLTGVVQISAGAAHTCALLNATGGVRCWGWNSYGQVGVSKPGVTDSPPTSDLLIGVARVAAGWDHTCVLMRGTGGVRCWGDNRFGQLGVGNISGPLGPSNIDIMTGAISIAAGKFFTCVVLNETGGVKCWGNNTWGQLGTGDTSSLLRASDSYILTGISEIAAERFHACALGSNGTVFCWGWNGEGQLGINNNISYLTSPYVVPLSAKATQVSVGYSNACAVMNDRGGVTCWGDNMFGQLGTGPSVIIPGFHIVLHGVAHVVEGVGSTCVLMNRTSGVRCWGSNGYGQLGIGDFLPLFSPPGRDIVFPLA